MKESNSTWVVQKYGGTSLGKLLNEITRKIIPSSLEHDRVAVVCSARSGTTKSTGTTKLLLEAIACATDPSLGSGERLDHVISTIRDQHLEAVSSAVDHESRDACGKPTQELELSMIEECESLRTFLHAARTIGELSPRSQDRVLALGEKLACLIVATSLEHRGVGAKVVLLDDIVEQAYQSDPNGPEAAYEELGTHFFDRISVEIGERIRECGERVPIVTGEHKQCAHTPRMFIHLTTPQDSLGQCHIPFSTVLAGAIQTSAQQCVLWASALVKSRYGRKSMGFLPRILTKCCRLGYSRQ